MIFVYEVARVVAPAPDAPMTSDSKTTYTYFLSDKTPRTLAIWLRGSGNTVIHDERSGGQLGGGQLIPWRNQVVYVNWRTVGDLAFPDGWYLSIKAIVDADAEGVAAQMGDDRRAAANIPINQYKVKLQRQVIQTLTVPVEAPNEFDAGELAETIAEDGDLGWGDSDLDSGGAYIIDVEEV